MRLPYRPRTLDTDNNNAAAVASEPLQEAYTTLAARRAPQPLLALDQTLLHSPAVATGWSAFFGAIRTGTSLGADVRELIICRIATLNGAPYEWDQHVGLLRQALRDVLVGDLGLKEEAVGEAVDTVRQRKAWMGWDASARTRSRRDVGGGDGGAAAAAAAAGPGRPRGVDLVYPGGLTEMQCAALAYADAMTVGVKVADPIFERLQRSFDAQGGVEVTATAAGYNCVSRFLVALDVGEMAQAQAERER